jgi:hypothetical protein
VGIDVTTEVEIGRPRDEVAAYASDPDTATEWYANIAFGLSRVVAPVMERAVRRANRKDLANLKRILETHPAAAPRQPGA